MINLEIIEIKAVIPYNFCPAWLSPIPAASPAYLEARDCRLMPMPTVSCLLDYPLCKMTT